MILKVQILTLFFSFIFGIYFSYMIKINYKYIFNLKRFYKITGTILLITLNVLIYFIILLKINNGIIHTYSLLMIILGSYIEYLLGLIVKHNKK